MLRKAYRPPRSSPRAPVSCAPNLPVLHSPWISHDSCSPLFSCVPYCASLSPGRTRPPPTNFVSLRLLVTP